MLTLFILPQANASQWRKPNAKKQERTIQPQWDWMLGSAGTPLACEEPWFGNCITWAHSSSAHHHDRKCLVDWVLYGVRIPDRARTVSLSSLAPFLPPVLSAKFCLENDSGIFLNAFHSVPSASPCDSCDSWNTDQFVKGYYIPVNTSPINCKETVPFRAEVCAQRCLTPNPQSTASRLRPHGYKGYPGTLTHDSYSLVPTKGYSMLSYFTVRPIKGRDGVCVMGCLD